jgi:hypothetical protein
MAGTILVWYATGQIPPPELSAGNGGIRGAHHTLLDVVSAMKPTDPALRAPADILGS